MLHLGNDVSVPEKHIVAIVGVKATYHPFPRGMPPVVRAGKPPYKSIVLVDDGRSQRVIYSPVSPVTLRRRLQSGPG